MFLKNKYIFILNQIIARRFKATICASKVGIVDIYSKYIGLQYLKMAVNEYDVGLIQRNLKLSWTGDYESLKYLVKNYLNLAGDWVSPGGEKKTFHGDNITISCLKNKKLIQVEGSNATAIIQKLLSFFNSESTDLRFKNLNPIMCKWAPAVIATIYNLLKQLKASMRWFNCWQMSFVFQREILAF